MRACPRELITSTLPTKMFVRWGNRRFAQRRLSQVEEEECSQLILLFPIQWRNCLRLRAPDATFLHVTARRSEWSLRLSVIFYWLHADYRG